MSMRNALILALLVPAAVSAQDPTKTPAELYCHAVGEGRLIWVRTSTPSPTPIDPMDPVYWATAQYERDITLLRVDGTYDDGWLDVPSVAREAHDFHLEIVGGTHRVPIELTTRSNGDYLFAVSVAVPAPRDVDSYDVRLYWVDIYTDQAAWVQSVPQCTEVTIR